MQAMQEKNSFRRSICQKPFEPFGQIDGRALVDLVGTGDQARVCRKLCQQPERLLCAELLIAFRHKDRILAAQIRRQRFRRVKKRRSCDLKPLRIFVAKAAQQRAEAQALAAENGYYDESSSNPYNDILADTYESAYARRLRGFESPTYKMPSSYWNLRYSGTFNYLTAYDPAFYNIIVMGDEVWVEPKYITSMFGTWGLATGFAAGYMAGIYGSWYSSWGYGWPYYGWGYGPYWGWGGWYNPWWNHSYWYGGYYPYWGHPHWGHPHYYRPRPNYRLNNNGSIPRNYRSYGTPSRNGSYRNYGTSGSGSRGGSYNSNRNNSGGVYYNSGGRSNNSSNVYRGNGNTYNNNSYNERENSYRSNSTYRNNSGSSFNSGSRGGSGGGTSSGGSRGFRGR